MRVLAALLILAASPAGAARAKAGREVVHSAAHFKMSVPAGWTDALMGADEMGSGASGAVFKSSDSARIVVVFYAAGNPHFKDAADYLVRQTAALPVAPAGEKTGPAEPGALGELKGQRFSREKRGAKELVAVAEGRGGFYAVTCSAPAREWKSLAPRFERALASFALLPPPPRPAP